MTRLKYEKIFKMVLPTLQIYTSSSGDELVPIWLLACVLHKVKTVTLYQWISLLHITHSLEGLLSSLLRLHCAYTNMMTRFNLPLLCNLWISLSSTCSPRSTSLDIILFTHTFAHQSSLHKPVLESVSRVMPFLFSSFSPLPGFYESPTASLSLRGILDIRLRKENAIYH
jgi:hypothetical protein